jgi:hypothetical protein
MFGYYQLIADNQRVLFLPTELTRLICCKHHKFPFISSQFLNFSKKKKLFLIWFHLTLCENQKFPVLVTNFEKYLKKFSFLFSKTKTRELRSLFCPQTKSLMVLLKHFVDRPLFLLRFLRLLKFFLIRRLSLLWFLHLLKRFFYQMLAPSTTPTRPKTATITSSSNSRPWRACTGRSSKGAARNTATCFTISARLKIYAKPSWRLTQN